jgi:hypothetical protein
VNGAAPAGTAEQVPSLPITPHELQVPVQAVEQQMPWAQMPELHSAPEAHALPFGLPLPHVPAGSVHVLGEAQSLVLAHVVLQTLLVVSQPYGSQRELVTVLQEPVPSQVRAGVSVDPVQLPATQTVPLA